jgi:hypothetical protein
MGYSDLVHELVLEHVRKKLSREYKEVAVNRKGEKKAQYEGYYPDVILGNHGIVLALLEIETADTLSEKQAETWKAMSGLGVKLIVMIPKELRMRVTDLLWSKGIMDRVSVGTYEIAVHMP